MRTTVLACLTGTILVVCSTALTSGAEIESAGMYVHHISTCSLYKWMACFSLICSATYNLRCYPEKNQGGRHFGVNFKEDCCDKNGKSYDIRVVTSATPPCVVWVNRNCDDPPQPPCCDCNCHNTTTPAENWMHHELFISQMHVYHNLDRYA